MVGFILCLHHTTSPQHTLHSSMHHTQNWYTDIQITCYIISNKCLTWSITHEWTLVFVAFSEPGCNPGCPSLWRHLVNIDLSENQISRPYRRVVTLANLGEQYRGRRIFSFCWKEKQWKEKGTESKEVKIQSVGRLEMGGAILLHTTSSESICRVEKFVKVAEQRGEEWGRKKGREKKPKGGAEIHTRQQMRFCSAEEDSARARVWTSCRPKWNCSLLTFDNPPWITSRLCCAFLWTRRPPSATASWPF